MRGERTNHKGIQKHFRPNDNENAVHRNLCDAGEVTLTRRLLALKVAKLLVLEKTKV